ncbi:hypothetical protein C1X05_09825 [Laceyella sacchari]|jgi:hypothetical protein|uniref:Spo0E like sporulation regulatory protein n=2 Tax=Laceyella TaxID=292635 RepID=A0AA46AH45_9BACL|nr:MULTISPECIES: aspartyl-phosphate phosphatase Spo0E family protein [Laceyella]AUS09121.1 hypothetical protein C1X05_09825 [Laceyella sacchari]MRG28119.1 Spo0E family sporulation regulatory protein-aspartic acid phosphatase [Laceyella tengchongensis]PRZ11859.1 Spo0E like sporulation regulatory protein [Laceyella sediminis]SMP35590.1 Spo0E like sporulation regulatory protein [Laceyella tengchongensis]
MTEESLSHLEQEMERLRSQLHQSVEGEPSRLSAEHVLPLSKRLDTLIVAMQKAKRICRQTRIG